MTWFHDLLLSVRVERKWRHYLFVFLFGVVFNPESRVVTTFCQKSLQCQFGFCILKLKVLHLLHHAQSIVAEGFKNKTRCCSLQKMNIEDSGEKIRHNPSWNPHTSFNKLFCFLLRFWCHHPAAIHCHQLSDQNRIMLGPYFWLTKLTVRNEQIWSLKTPQNGA